MRLNTDKATDALIRGLIAMAGLLPYRMRVRVFGAITGYLVAPLGGYIRRAVTNLHWVFPDMPRAETRRIARAVAVNFGKNIIENYSKDDMAKALKTAKIGGEGMAALQQALAEKRPVLLMSGHIGNYEAFRIAMFNMGHPVAGLYRPASNPYFNSHYVETLEQLSGPAFAQNRAGVLGFTRHLHDGGVAAMLFDVRATRYGDIDFLGKPAPTSTFPAEIALKTGALFLPVFAHRGPDGISHEVEFEAPIPPSTSHEMTVELTRRLEAQVLRYPEQWLWIHDRWGSEYLRKKRAAKRSSQQ
ncbi:lysophospholipid acyltransferase family protein [Paenirhodobacter sp. CAU 1674]|jgi:KDO2-lipid IV(A) lauroyltransferase|uniref:lysophospholipid acyltransferase family protein n=1 Tax=Paenirhodobacter sp. CAU 1674 TaxID=3032596 RepID=UPI0023D9B550|nr:lysophospholipid acyltransferase family protein [Paenirhodobacter sp. CAU 1674]MDF2140484.1 lysophospholipid acyltransferase family protein [Paenirhodobacter sp. CAU 1674]